MDHLSYKHSGKITLAGVAYALLVAFIVGPILAIIYSAATIYIPFIYVNAILSAGFGGVLGLAVHFALEMGHTRNLGATVVITLLVTLITYYLHWVLWFGVQAWRGDDSFSGSFFLLFPPFLFEAVGELNEYGSWSLRGSNVTGIMLTIVWLIEAAVIFGVSVFAAWALAAETVYCESCKTWCVEHLNVRQYAMATTDITGLVSRLSSGDLGVLREPQPPHPEDTAWHQIDLRECPSCGVTNTMTLRTITNTVNQKGENEQKSDIVVDRVLLTKEQADWLCDAPAPLQG